MAAVLWFSVNSLRVERFWIRSIIWDESRKESLVLKESKIGVVIGYLRELPSSNTPHLIDNLRPSGIFAIGDNFTIKTPDYDSELWLVTNDILLHKDAQIAYAGDNPSQSLIDKWNDIERDKSWDIFWEDNIGQFLIHIVELD